jgi:hypothetical protein
MRNGAAAAHGASIQSELRGHDKPEPGFHHPMPDFRHLNISQDFGFQP